MRKKLLAIGSALALTLLSASTASALTITDARFVGTVIDGIPPNEQNEVDYINSLIVQPINTTQACSEAPTESCIRSSNPGPFPTAILAGFDKDETDPLNPFDATGFAYVIAKYGSGNSGGGEYVWYIAGLGAGQTVPENFGTGGPGLSHVSLVNADQFDVPDGGTTAALLGLSLVGLGMIRRRINL